MINKKLDYSFEALYRLKKKNLLTQTGKGKNPTYSSEQIILSKQSGLDDILTNITSVNKVPLPTLTEWITFNAATFQTFIIPGPMAADGQGNFYIGNTYNPTSQITKVNSNGTYVSYLTPPSGSVTPYIPGTLGADGWPWGLAYLNGSLYASDMRKHFIFQIDQFGNFNSVIGLSGTSGFTSGLSGANSRITTPMALLSDGTNLYICQGDNNAISKFSLGILTTFAGTGALGYLDGPAASAIFNNPNNMFFDNLGNIIVCDTDNHRIRKIDTFTRVVSTVAGTGVSGNLDGPVASATFNGPNAGCCDSNGNLYISSASFFNGNDISIIRKISNGIVSTIFTRTVRGMPDSPFISNLYYYEGYVYVSEQSTSNTYRFKV